MSHLKLNQYTKLFFSWLIYKLHSVKCVFKVFLVLIFSHLNRTYSVQIRENTDHKNSKYGHLSHIIDLQRFVTTLRIFWPVKFLKTVSSQRFTSGYLHISKIILFHNTSVHRTLSKTYDRALAGFFIHLWTRSNQSRIQDSRKHLRWRALQH